MSSNPATRSKNMAGPLLRGGEIAMAACEAIQEDNPEKQVLIEDHRTYVRVEAEGGLIIRRKTMEEILGRPFRMQELEVNLTGFSGQIETDENYMRWYLKLDL
ncbi:MAG: monooxygenase [Alphaproteobacteria bacterium]|nr:monooxygenase [Alphaproteobacteria bacterium]